MDSLEITTLDISKFFYKQDIGVIKRTEIILDLWNNKTKFLEYRMYESLRSFSNEINNILLDICLGNILFDEVDEIIAMQGGLDSSYIGYGVYKLNKNMTEDFLKQCKLRLIYDSKREYISMKMRTLVKACGYKRRNKNMIEELINKFFKLELYMNDGNRELMSNLNDSFKKIEAIKMDEYIRIYSY